VSDKAAPCSLDHVNRQFHAPAPNVLWVSDFTYGAPRPGWSGVHIAGMLMRKEKKEGRLALCCERARAQAAVTCRQLAG
jgi:transposase InsO family protein